MEASGVSDWAAQTFGSARLNDPRRTRRLVGMAEAVALRPAGTVTASMRSEAEREGAFRFLESRKVRSEEICRAAFDATALRCRDRITYVPLDQSDLSFTDRKGVRGLGPDCYRQSKEIRSLQVMTALALDGDGTPIGVLEQEMWLRPEERTPPHKKDRRPAEERESWRWVTTLRGACERLEACASPTRPWFICDRAADCHALLCAAVDSGALFTVRSSYERTIERAGRHRKLWTTLRRQPILGYVEVFVPPQEGRVGRIARLEMRALSANVRIRKAKQGERWTHLSCVRAREVDTTPPGEKPIEWKLLSNHQVRDLTDAKLILSSYTKRWRIEEFHKTWKSGACKVERSQLRSLEAIRRWATILAAVAARIERLKQISRTQPDLDASEEFTREELDAAIILTKTSKYQVGDPLTMQQAVALVGIVGGHMGRRGDGPPGTITLRRGLEQVAPAALALKVARTCG